MADSWGFLHSIIDNTNGQFGFLCYLIILIISSIHDCAIEAVFSFDVIFRCNCGWIWLSKVHIELTDFLALPGTGAGAFWATVSHQLLHVADERVLQLASGLYQ